MIPAIFARYLSFIDENFTLEERIAYLIKSLDGDSYYMFDELPEKGVISEEFGELVYEELQDGNWSYKDILGWYKVWDY